MKNDKIKLRVKAFSKGDTMINYMDDTEIAIEQKINKNDKNKLSFKEKDSLRNLLDAIIANRKFNETEENGNENENLTQLIDKENINLIEIFTFIRKMYLNGLSISAINLEKLSEISIKHEILDWLSFLISEMKRKKLEINKKILDEFLNLYSFEIMNPKTTKTNKEINKIWLEFKKMNPNADSFLSTQKKLLKVGSASFLPTNDH